MKRRFCLFAFFALSLFPPSSVGAVQVAITVDDLPGEPANLAAIASALARHGVPVSYGFVNGIQVQKQPERREALKAWLRAGNFLGNHTYSHADLRSMEVSAYLDDIARNEPLLADLTGDAHSWRVFRYPFLLEGIDVAARDVIRAYLKEHDYRVAPMTINFSDWAFNAPYNRCREQQDPNGVDAVRERYLAEAKVHLDWADGAAREFFHRAIAHILIIHAKTVTADLIAPLLTMYEAAGVEFIELKDALADSAYGADVGGAQHGSFLEQLMVAQPGVVSVPFPERPTTWLDERCCPKRYAPPSPLRPHQPRLPSSRTTCR